jgi:hypothetical protein
MVLKDPSLEQKILDENHRPNRGANEVPNTTFGNHLVSLVESIWGENKVVKSIPGTEVTDESTSID